MNSFNFPWRKTAFTALLASASFISLNAYAGKLEAPGLLSTVPGKSQARLPDEAIAARSKAVRINYGQLRSGRFSVDLPGGVSLDAVRDLQQEMGGNKYAWVGHANGNPANRVVIGISGDAVAGSFFYEGRLFKLEPRPDGSHVISEVETGDPAPELDPIPVDADTGTAGATGSGDAVAADGGTIIDVLVAYTPQVQSRYGVSGAEALVVQAVAEANQAYTNSGMAQRLNLVHSVLTNYTESGSMNTDISRLRSTSDGYMDELHALRDSYGADQVSLLEHEPQYCGLAYRMTSASASFASSAFSVVHHSCATGYYSFAHELGHNQGAHHDPDNASGAIYPYAYGHQEPSNAFRTVMAYNCSGGCSRVDHFSNPDVLYNSNPTGVVGYSDNALALDNTAATVASFRQVQAQNPPSAPSGLAATSVSHSAIELIWTDTSADESGFTLERAKDGQGFVQVASLAANTGSFLDDGLLADTLYSYRVQSWNSAGNSTYSDVAVAATDTAPPITDQVAGADLPVAGSVSGTYKGTWSDDGAFETITERQSGGRKNKRYAYLEHKWTFQVQPGDSIALFADARTSAGTESFTFSYSSDNSQYTDMFTVTSGNSGAQQFTLPPTLSGTVYVRVRDNVRQAGSSTSQSVQVDQLVIRSENGASLPLPSAPYGLSATADGANSITINWADASDSEYGFAIERRVDGSSQWQQVNTTGANATSYTNTGLQAATLYHYRVNAFNSTGQSAYSASDSALTDEQLAANIDLSARGYKVKGKQRADLSWSGAQSGRVDIYRDGSLIAGSVSNSGGHTDNIGRKGGGSYQYEICEENSSSCSNVDSVVF